MNQVEVIGYTHPDGYILCDACGESLAKTGLVRPILADQHVFFIGWSCDCCSQELSPSGTWVCRLDHFEDLEPDWDDAYDASSALASAGWGVDEDYRGDSGDWN